MAGKKKQGLILLAVLIAAAVITSAFIHAGEDDFLIDPARIAASWEVAEIWQDDKLVSDNQTVILIDIDKNGGFHLWNDEPRNEQMGKLEVADGQLRFTGDDGWIYDIHGRQRQLIVTARKGKKEQTWICQRSGYCRDAQRTEEERLDAYFAIQKKAMAIEDGTQRNLYVAAMIMIDGGYPEGKAITKAKAYCVRGRAFVWYGEEHGIVFSDKEMEEYLSEYAKLLKEHPEALEGYDAALKKVGMTYEDYIWVNAEAHRWDRYESSVYRKSSLEMENLDQDVVNRFHHTKAYRNLKVELDTAIENIKEEL